MLYLDGISLNKIKIELEKELVGKKIGKITQETELSISFVFGKISLVISCSQALPICYITDEKRDGLNETFSFILTLKKYFLNSQLTKIEQLGFDRILCFSFEKLNELGIKNSYKLYFEIMGKHSNLIVTDSDNKILDLLKRFSIEENKLRVLLPGAEYEQPIITKKKSPFDISIEDFKTLDSKTLYDSVEGFGKLASLSIKNFDDFKNMLNSKLTPKIYYLGNKPVLGTVLDGLSPKNFDRVQEFESFSELTTFYIKENAMSSANESMASKLVSLIKKRIKKTEKIIENIKKDDIEKENYMSFKEIGDILSANIYSLKKYISSSELFDFYNNKMITIELDKSLTPEKNIALYYKKYNKFKRGLESNKRRIEEVSSELNYLYSVLNFLENAKSMDILKSIEEELRNEGYLRNEPIKNKKNKKEKNKTSYFIAEQDDNFSILYGRNNLENDYLTFKIADKNDLWFHIKDIPGSHVILKYNKSYYFENSKELDELILKSAKIALNFSKLNNGDRATVEYTEKRYVTKPNSARPGFVIYTNQKSILLTKGE